MSKAHERRLQALEATKAGGLGLRIFQQSLTDATVYYEGCLLYTSDAADE